MNFRDNSRLESIALQIESLDIKNHIDRSCIAYDIASAYFDEKKTEIPHLVNNLFLCT